MLPDNAGKHHCEKSQIREQECRRQRSGASAGCDHPYASGCLHQAQDHMRAADDAEHVLGLQNALKDRRGAGQHQAGTDDKDKERDVRPRPARQDASNTNAIDQQRQDQLERNEPAGIARNEAGLA